MENGYEMWNVELGWILGKEDGKMWTVFIWLRIGTSGRFL
jgi:hypothetical protein